MTEEGNIVVSGIELLGCTVLLGIGATLFMDGVAWIRKKVMHVSPLDYGLVGRWLLSQLDGVFWHSSILSAPAIKYERLTGWIFHYLTGIAFAAVMLFATGYQWLEEPTVLPPLLTGLISTVAPFFIMQPAFGFGWAASKTPSPNTARLNTIIAHLSYGAGLYFSGLFIMQW